METTRLIKRYSNRKLYDTTTSKYITLKNILEFAETGIEFKVIENKTKEEITDRIFLKSVVEECTNISEITELLRAAVITKTEGGSNE